MAATSYAFELLSAAVRAVEDPFLVFSSAPCPRIPTDDNVGEGVPGALAALIPAADGEGGKRTATADVGKDAEDDAQGPPEKRRKTGTGEGDAVRSGADGGDDDESSSSGSAEKVDEALAAGTGFLPLTFPTKAPRQGDRLMVYQGFGVPRPVQSAPPAEPAEVLRAKAAFSAVLERACEPAPFGDGGRTVYDESVRKALQVPASRIAATALDLESLGIMRRVREELCPPGWSVKAKLHKLNVYSAGGFFAPHKDTPYQEDVFGTVVVCLPSRFKGGQLVLRHGPVQRVLDWQNGTEKYSTWARSIPQLQWAAFYGHVEHEVTRVTEGHRVTLTYTLHRDTSDASTETAEMALLSKLLSAEDEDATSVSGPASESASESAAAISAGKAESDDDDGDAAASSKRKAAPAFDKDALEEQLKPKKLPELKALLKEKDLKVSGSKDVLIQRLVAQARDESQGVYSEPELEKKKLPVLKAMCKARGLAVSGAKADLVGRLFEQMGGASSLSVAPATTSPVAEAPPRDAMTSGLRLLRALQDCLADETFLPDGGKLGIACTHSYERAAELPKPNALTVKTTGKKIQLKGRDAVVMIAAARLGLTCTVHRALHVPEVGWYPLDAQTLGNKNLVGIGRTVTHNQHVEGYGSAPCIDCEDPGWTEDSDVLFGVTDWIIELEDRQAGNIPIQTVHFSGTGYYGNEASSDTMYAKAVITIDFPPWPTRQTLLRSTATPDDARAFLGLKIALETPAQVVARKTQEQRAAEEEKWRKKVASQKKAKAKRRRKAGAKRGSKRVSMWW
jgi:hypothetical protein